MIRHRAFALLLAGLGALVCATAAAASTACKPLLSMAAVQERRVSVIPVVPWIWRATIQADASFCATRAGNFEIDFIRLKENSKDLQFTHKFRWREGLFEAMVEFAPDESVFDYRIGFISSCVCRELPTDE